MVTAPLTYRLLDGEALNRAHPDTFEIPTAEARKSVRPGNWVKLGFDILNRIDRYGEERMWVSVDESNADGYRGTLRSSPYYDVGAAQGDPIAFAPRHILNVADDEDDVSAQAVLMRGAIVSRRICDDSAWPGWLKRGEPVNGHDSGWVLLAGDEDEAYTDDTDNFCVVLLRDILAEAPEPLVNLLLTGDHGTTWEWNAETELYEQIPTDVGAQSL
jgi:hypothetical protein